jgi:hypothetical protein
VRFGKKEEVFMAKKTILKVTVFDDGTAEISRGSDCDNKVTRIPTKKKKAKKKP